MNKIKEIRTAKKMTQQQLADATGLERSHIGRWETGARNPKLDKLQKIAEALGCELSDLF